MKTIKLLIIGFLPLIALIALPVLLRPPTQKSLSESDTKTSRDMGETHGADSEQTLIIITPHNESIRYEFEEAFKAHYFDIHGKNITLDWRMPGGTSDITRYIDDRFASEFKRYWEGNPSLSAWSQIIEKNFNNSKIDSPAEDTDSTAIKARKSFLDSNVGIGIDLFFGGGQYEMEKQVRKGYAVDAGLLQLHPEWFNENVIPHKFSGELFYDAKGCYYGTCISSFGICYNEDCIKLLGIPAPKRWQNLGDKKFFGVLAVADPTKSGSINKCFEMLVQQSMADAIRAFGGKTPEALEKGWADGLNLIKRIGANSRYITDSASKVPRDVAKGDTSAGICIDFYGRTEAEWAQKQSGGKIRLTYVTPIGGSSVSADPILLFRGAPNKKIAVEFIEFVLSKKGQRIWNSRPGTPGGPKKYALRRLPVRKDLYVQEERINMSDPDASPFSPEEEFNYDPSLTAKQFTLIRLIIKAMVIDPLPELQKAWMSIIKTDAPNNSSKAIEEFDKLPFKYSESNAISTLLNPTAKGNTPLLVLEEQRKMSEFFRNQYIKSANLATNQKTN